MIVINKRLLKRLKRWIAKGNSMKCFSTNRSEFIDCTRELKIGEECISIYINIGKNAINGSVFQEQKDVDCDWRLFIKRIESERFKKWADEAIADYEKELRRHQRALAKKILGVA